MVPLLQKSPVDWAFVTEVLSSKFVVLLLSLYFLAILEIPLGKWRGEPLASREVVGRLKHPQLHALCERQRQVPHLVHTRSDRD